MTLRLGLLANLKFPILVIDGVRRTGMVATFDVPPETPGPRRLDGRPVRRAAWLLHPLDGGPPLKGAILFNHLAHLNG